MTIDLSKYDIEIGDTRLVNLAVALGRGDSLQDICLYISRQTRAMAEAYDAKVQDLQQDIESLVEDLADERAARQRLLSATRRSRRIARRARLTAFHDFAQQFRYRWANAA